MTLYEINEEYRRVLETIEVNEDGEIIGVEALEEIEGKIEEKLEAIAVIIKEKEADKAGYKAEADRISKNIKSIDRSIEWLKDYAKSGLKMLDIKKLETAKAKLSIRNSESVEIDDLTAIPTTYMRIKTTEEADKVAIKKALKDGAVISGAHLVTKENVQIG